MKKVRKILPLALLVLTAIYGVFVVWSFFEYNAYVSDLYAEYEDLGISSDYVNPRLYVEFWYSNVTIVTGLGLGITWICVAAFLAHKKKSAMMLLAILMISVFLLRTPGAKANLVSEETQAGILGRVYVNSLLYFDEECTREDDRKWEHDIMFVDMENSMYPHRKFLDSFDIEFVCLNGWNQNWDSDDSKHSAFYMLQEAIEQLGGVYDPELPAWVWKPKLYFDGSSYSMAHLLIVFTDQEMDLNGLSPPDWNACIIKIDAYMSVNQHELSHQFWAPHCDNLCVMNPTYCAWPFYYRHWCGPCGAVITSNRGKWCCSFILSISAGAGGTTSPSPTAHEYPKGESVAVTASARSGYIFNCWVLDKKIKHGNPITVTMNSDHRLKAYFRLLVPPGWGNGCPILSVFNGSTYVTEGLLDIHNADDIDVFRNHTLITAPVPVNNQYLLRLTEHPQTHSYIDQVELFATLEDGTTIQLPLTSAIHSEEGNVLPLLLRSDDVRTDTDANQTIDLKFASLNLEVISFIFHIEGHNTFMKL